MHNTRTAVRASDSTVHMYASCQKKYYVLVLTEFHTTPAYFPQGLQHTHTAHTKNKKDITEIVTTVLNIFFYLFYYVHKRSGSY